MASVCRTVIYPPWVNQFWCSIKHSGLGIRARLMGGEITLFARDPECEVGPDDVSPQTP
ncbi:MAG: hypothetical protein AAF501_17285 [Pseudomonadota bacterium]